MATSNVTTRSLLEVALGFLGALLIVPLAFKLVKLTFGTVFAVVGGLFRVRTTRRLIGDLAVGGLTALLARPEVLDMVFGSRDSEDEPKRLSGPRR